MLRSRAHVPSHGAAGVALQHRAADDEDAGPGSGSLDSARTCPRLRGTTRPLRDRGELPRLSPEARPEGCDAAWSSPLRGKAGDPVSLGIHSRFSGLLRRPKKNQSGAVCRLAVKTLSSPAHCALCLTAKQVLSLLRIARLQPRNCHPRRKEGRLPPDV